jgi:hypothetical protein
MVNKDLDLQIKRVANSEFPVTNQYRDELYNFVSRFVHHSHFEDRQILLCLQIWENALREMRTARKLSDFTTIKDNGFRQIIIDTNSREYTEISPLKTNPDQYIFVMYMDILSLYGIICKKLTISIETLDKMSRKAGKSIQELEDFYRKHVQAARD